LISSGAKDYIQALDKVDFGLMKSEVRRVFRRISQDPELKYFKRAAVTDTINNMRQIIGANS
jgi:hypothetical protein